MTKTVFITGANKGIGFETAKQLGANGWTVLVGARDEQRGQAAVAQLTHKKAPQRPTTGLLWGFLRLMR